MLRSFRHKRLESFFRTGSKAGIRVAHANRLRLQLGLLDAAKQPVDVNLPGWRLHALRGDLDGHWAIWVDKSWRLTFTFAGADVMAVDYRDYH